jgi:hypothetical protein
MNTHANRDLEMGALWATSVRLSDAAVSNIVVTKCSEATFSNLRLAPQIRIGLVIFQSDRRIIVSARCAAITGALETGHKRVYSTGEHTKENYLLPWSGRWMGLNRMRWKSSRHNIQP